MALSVIARSASDEAIYGMQREGTMIWNIATNAIVFKTQVASLRSQ